MYVLKASLLLVFLGIGIDYVSARFNDPCIPRAGVGKGTVTPCAKRGGRCYDDRCLPPCPNSHIKRYDLCSGTHKYCCLKQKPTSRVCRIYGDPHIQTFDAYYYSVQKEGTFTLVELCQGAAEFIIKGVFTYPHEFSRFSLVTEFSVTLLSGKTIRVSCSPLQVWFDGGIVGLPFEDAECKIYKSGGHLYVHMKQLGILIDFKCNRMNIYLLDNRWIGKLCGLCGIYNNNVRDDADSVKQYRTLDIKCPEEGTTETQAVCRSRINKLKKECPDLNINEFLESCALDECIGGRNASQLTLDAILDDCKDDAGKEIMAIENRTMTTTTTRLPPG